MKMDPQTAAQRQAQKEQRFKQLDHLAWLLDDSIPIPGTGRKVGIDGILGLIPGVGDFTGGLASSYIFFQAMRMGIPVAVLIKMVINILLETVMGTIPVVGDLFDFVYKANKRNVDLMRSYVENPTRVKQRSTWQVVLVVGVMLAIVCLLIVAMWSLLAALFSAVL